MTNPVHNIPENSVLTLRRIEFPSWQGGLGTVLTVRKFFLPCSFGLRTQFAQKDGQFPSTLRLRYASLDFRAQVNGLLSWPSIPAFAHRSRTNVSIEDVSRVFPCLFCPAPTSPPSCHNCRILYGEQALFHCHSY